MAPASPAHARARDRQAQRRRGARSIARAQRKQAALVVLQGSESEIGTHVMLDKPVTIGRDPKIELPLQDEGISRRHCRIAFDKEKTASSSRISARPTARCSTASGCKRRKKLEAGDRIYLGACVRQVHLLRRARGRLSRADGRAGRHRRSDRAHRQAPLRRRLRARASTTRAACARRSP